MGLVSIHHPSNPEHELLIDQKAFDPSLHRRWEQRDDRKDASTPASVGPKVDRLGELIAIYEGSQGWRTIKAIADGLGISKTDEEGWDSVIPLIVEAEGEAG